jgi:hypothetical protein
MVRAFSLAAVAVMLSAPVFAETAAVTCSTADAAKFQPVATLQAKLEATGLTVSEIKTEGGCYEAYTVDKAGAMATLGFNAETLEPVANAEAGEGN